ncbi:MAG TPA: DUF167 domain-containing protein [Methylomirabilota bacterium]|nr:DUF167 domain-containing protein [Methylomirabilota bacterium]
MLALTRSGDRILFSVRVAPRAASGLIAGERDGALVVRVTAPPAEGRANEAVLKIVARALGLPTSAVRLVRGARARTKVLSVPAAAEARLAGLLL